MKDIFCFLVGTYFRRPGKSIKRATTIYVCGWIAKPTKSLNVEYHYLGEFKKRSNLAKFLHKHTYVVRVLYTYYPTLWIIELFLTSSDF